MNPTAIVYVSNTGHTARYAGLLGAKLGLPAYSLAQAQKELAKGSPVIFLGWLFASNIKGYSKAAKLYDIRAVCGVGLCTTGALHEEVRRTANVPAATPLFTVQGGMDRSKLKGVNKFMIDMLTKFMSGKNNKTDGEEQMLTLLREGGDYVSEDNLAAVIEWYGKR